MKRWKQLLAGGVLLWLTLALVTLPSEAMDAARTGLVLCYRVIIPSLFPFLILSSLLVELGLASALGRLASPLMWPLFRVSGAGASALVLGLLGGYPVGARTAAELVRTGQCSREEGERLLFFCNNSGPAFILGVAGVGVFQSTSIGLLLYGIHAASALAVGFLFRLLCPPATGNKKAAPAPPVRAIRASSALPAAVQSALTSTLSICAFVVCFTVLIRLLSATGVLAALAALLAPLLSLLRLDLTWLPSLLAGLLEISTGITSLAGTGALPERITLAAFLLGWSGVSVHCQAAALLEGSGLRAVNLWVGKLCHAVFSALLAWFLCRRLFPATSVSVFAPSTGQTALPAFHFVPLVSALALAALILLFIRAKQKITRFH